MENQKIDVVAFAGEAEGSMGKDLLRKSFITLCVVSALVWACCKSDVGKSMFTQDYDDEGSSAADIDLPSFMKEREAIFWGDCDYDPVVPAYGPENFCAGLNAAFIWGGHSDWAFEELYKKDLDLMFEGGSWTEYKLSENPTITQQELLQYQVVYVEDPYRNGFEVATWLEGDGANLLETVAELGVAVFVNIYTLRSKPIPLPYGARLEKPSPFAVSMTFPEPILDNELYQGEFQNMEESYSGWAAAFVVVDYPGWMKPLTVNANDPDQALSVGGETKLGNRVLLSGMNHPLYWGDTPEAFHLRANMFQYVCDTGEPELGTNTDSPTAAPTCASEAAWMQCPDRNTCFRNLGMDHLEGFTHKFVRKNDPNGCVLLAEVDSCVFRGDNMPVVANVEVVTKGGTELRIFNVRKGYAISDVYYYYEREPLPLSNSTGLPTTETEYFVEGEIESGPGSMLVVDYPKKNYQRNRYLTVQAKVCKV